MTFASRSLDARSWNQLRDVDPRLIAVVMLASMLHKADHPAVRVVVTDGVRTLEEQEEMVKRGASFTLDSYHRRGTAVDVAFIMGGKAIWDMKFFARFKDYMVKAMVHLGLSADDLTWGGDWTRLRDGPHFQLELERLP